MNIKIYHTTCTIYLTTNKNLAKEIANAIVLNTVPSLEYLNSLTKANLVLCNEDFNNLKKAFWQLFTPIIAAGGVVENQIKETLWIYRRGFWDLPKGKWDDGETIEECAVREIEEETGVNNLQLQNHITNTYHTYQQNGEWILKETYWYYITTTYVKKLVAQSEEDIEKVEWVKKEKLESYLKNTFPTIANVVALYKVQSVTN